MIKRWLLVTVHQLAIPKVTIFSSGFNGATLIASPTIFITPAWLPPDEIHADVLKAALIKPLRNTSLSLGLSLKFNAPPVTLLKFT